MVSPIGAGSTSLGRLIGQQFSAASNGFARLSSGRRINAASDDAAGLSISQGLQNSSRLGSSASLNISYGSSVSAIADGALGVISDVTGRLSELAAQSANGTLSDGQRDALNKEYQALREEIGRISETTQFNGQKLLDGSYNTTIQAGTTGGGESGLALNLPNVSGDALGIPTEISTQQSAQNALDPLENAAQFVSSTRADLGAFGSRLEAAQANISVV